MTALTISHQEVRTRRQVLETARTLLKDDFVGIDRIIDQLCDAIAVWYTMPQVPTRPIIINLWGMTGVGKTDLIRRLARYLDVTDRFIELELSTSGSAGGYTSVAERLSGVVGDGEPAMLLFDEIQRFHTIDRNGTEIRSNLFTDFWELLSDGRISRRRVEDIDFALAQLRLIEQGLEDADDPHRPDQIGLWRARQLRQSYGIGSSLEEVSQLGHEAAIGELIRARDSRRPFEPIDCSRCLVIISGNLDEAFTLAGQTAEADVDADIFHAFTTRVTMVDIKDALSRRFKPEQVARFGNQHLIYPGLRRQDFEALISRELARIERSAAQRFGVRVRIGPEVNRLVYRNGVFPVQGTRPVFSTVADLVESNLATLLYTALVDGADDITLDHDPVSRLMVAEIGWQDGSSATRVVRLEVPGAIDRIREGTNPDKVANVAAHEAGHALVYALLFGLAPLQVTARVAARYAGGFTFPHVLFGTAASLSAQVCVLLAGGLAEELLFGADNASVGRQSDRARATALIVEFVRTHGFDPDFQACYSLDDAHRMDPTVTDLDIEKTMSRLVADTRQLLAQYRPALVELATRLADQGHLAASEVRDILAGHGLEVLIRPEGYEWTPGYRRLLEAAQPDALAGRALIG